MYLQDTSTKIIHVNSCSSAHLFLGMIVNCSCFHTVTRLILISTVCFLNGITTQNVGGGEVSGRLNYAVQLQISIGIVLQRLWWAVSPREVKITTNASYITEPQLNGIYVGIMFPLIRLRRSGMAPTTCEWSWSWTRCCVMNYWHYPQPPAVSPSDVCHDVDVVCKASASYYYRSSYSHPTQNSQLKTYPQCKTGNVINE